MRSTARPKFYALAFVLLSSASVVAQESKHDYQKTEVSGNTIAWSCSGTGWPTIVLIAGGGLNAHDSFGRIYHSYDGPGRICMYDRAGMGESAFAKAHVRTLDQLVDEFRGLVTANSWENVVLVPHSFGGFIARGYAHRFPDDVHGLLFLDVAHEDWMPRLQAKMNVDDWAIMERVLDWTKRSVYEDYVQAQEAVRVTRLKNDIPITVLSRGIPYTRVRLEQMSYAGVDLFDGEHNVLQKEIAALSSNSEHRIARYSSHIFNDYDPWVVTEEIVRLVNRLPPELRD
jgi:pimeloyl-ACP methyl ester carboxylesterase